MYRSFRVFFAAICFCALSFPAHAGSIQMLPPVTEATKDSSNPTPCPGGESSSVLTWDGKTAIACANGVSASGGNVSASGSITPGSFTTGTACSTEGAIGYDKGAHAPAYCDGSTWRSMGSPKRIVCTYGRSTPASNSSYQAGGSVWGGNLFLHTFSAGECTGGVLPDSSYTAITPNWVGGCFVATETLEAFQYGSPYFPGFEMGVTNCESDGTWSVVYIQTDTAGQTAPNLDSPEWNAYENANGSPVLQ